MKTDQQIYKEATLSRKTAVTAGVLYLITHVTSIGAVFLYDPILKNTGYILSSGSDNGIILGALFDIILAIGVIGTAVALYPAVKWWNEGVALGYAGLRTLEASIIAVGVVPLLAVETLRQQLALSAGMDTMTLLTLSDALVLFHNWTFILGPGLVCGTNTVLMAYLMYKSKLVPRFIPILGLFGGPLIFAYNTALMFGLGDQLPSWIALVVSPIFAWELTLALWLIFKGFKRTALVSNFIPTTSNERVKVA